jgi:hypothetical protein
VLGGPLGVFNRDFWPFFLLSSGCGPCYLRAAAPPPCLFPPLPPPPLPRKNHTKQHRSAAPSSFVLYGAKRSEPQVRSCPRAPRVCASEKKLRARGKERVGERPGLLHPSPSLLASPARAARHRSVPPEPAAGRRSGTHRPLASRARAAGGGVMEPRARARGAREGPREKRQALLPSLSLPPTARARTQALRNPRTPATAVDLLTEHPLAHCAALFTARLGRLARRNEKARGGHNHPAPPRLGHAASASAHAAPLTPLPKTHTHTHTEHTTARETHTQP